MDKDEKSDNGGVKEPNLSPTMESESSPRPDEIEPGGISKMNSDGGEKEAEMDNGKGEKGGMFSVEDGSEKQSKRDDTDEAVANEHGEKTIADLPGDLLVKIIKILPIQQWPSLESISRSFQDAVYESWRHQREIRLDQDVVCNEEKKKANPCQIVEAILEYFLDRAPNVASISGFHEFTGQYKPIRLETIQLLSKFEHLETISFSGQDIITKDLFAVFLESSASRQSWKSLDISDGVAMGPIWDQVGYQSNLNLECFKFKTEMLGIFAGAPPIEWSRLEKLVIYNSDNFGIDVLSIIGQCPQVVHVEIALPDIYGQPSSIQIMRAVAGLENLSVLKISSAEGYLERRYEASLLQMIDGLGRHGRLTELSLADFDCSDQILVAIIRHLPGLKSLEMGICEKATIASRANAMGHLESLKLGSIRCLFDGAIIRAIVGNMGNLQRLHLVNVKGKPKDLNMLGELRNLKELRMTTGPGGIQRCIIATWARMGFGKCMETLEISFQYSITPETVKEFFDNMPRLSYLKLGDDGCSKDAFLQGHRRFVSKSGRIPFVGRLDGWNSINHRWLLEIENFEHSYVTWPSAGVDGWKVSENFLQALGAEANKRRFY